MNFLTKVLRSQKSDLARLRRCELCRLGTTTAGLGMPVVEVVVVVVMVVVMFVMVVVVVVVLVGGGSW